LDHGGVGAAYTELAAESPHKAGGAAATVVVFMPKTVQTAEVWTGLRDELVNDYRLVAVEVAGRGGTNVIAEGIARHRPSAIVLMNNPTLTAYREYQRQAITRPFPPAVVVMTSFLEVRPAEVAATTGISYEVPLITAVTNLRKLVATPVHRVGVVFRSRLRRFVERQVAIAAREQIGVALEELATDPNESDLKRAIRRIKGYAEAVWILNDDRLLTPHLIAEGWLPAMNERPWVPSIVGAASLISPELGFGTFAVLPDHTALGAQAANLLLEIAENNWSVAGNVEVQLPLSTTTTIDLLQARERFVLRADALTKVDRVLQ
jgi:hypothetical protein